MKLTHNGDNMQNLITFFNISYQLTHLSRMDLTPIISKMSPFPILGVSGGIFHFFQILIKQF